MYLEIRQVKLEIYIPEDFVEKIRDELSEAGFCKIGNYDCVIAYQQSKGYWRPLEGSNPFEGEKDKICFGTESKVEVRCPIQKVDEAISIIKKIHPYEEPIINIIPLL